MEDARDSLSISTGGGEVNWSHSSYLTALALCVHLHVLAYHLLSDGAFFDRRVLCCDRPHMAVGCGQLGPGALAPVNHNQRLGLPELWHSLWALRCPLHRRMACSLVAAIEVGEVAMAA